MKLITANKAVSTRENSMKLPSFSKQWNVNDQGIVFYPIVKIPETGKYDLLVGAVWGHNVDMQALGIKASFIPTTSEINERGEPVNPDITYQFSQIAKLFVDGMKEKEKAEVNAKDWDGLPTSALTSALEAIEKKYDAKNNMKAIGPAIKRLTYLITTECLYVPIVDDKPNVAAARLVTQTLSNDRIAKLLALLNSGMYGPNTTIDEATGMPHENWLEVGYTFTSARNDKGEAGRADPQGISPEMRLARRYPEAWESIRPKLSGLPKDSDTIANRNYSYRPVPESEVMNKIRTYCVLNSNNLSYLTEEGVEQLCRQAAVIDNLRIKVKKNEELQAKLDAAVAEYKKAHPTTESTEADVPFTQGAAADARDADIASTLGSMGAPTIQELMVGRLDENGNEPVVDGDFGTEDVEL